jgi:hypothetical protein
LFALVEEKDAPLVGLLFLYEDMIPDWKLGDTVSFLEGEEREAFLDLAKQKAT